jgi:hypothetical protein
MAGEIDLYQQTLSALNRLENAIRETWRLRHEYPALRTILFLAFINRRQLKQFLACADTKSTDWAFKP